MAYKDREQQRAYQREWVRRRRAEFLADKRCAFCNSGDELELHHFDPAVKVSHAIWSWSRKRREEEIAKCIVLCRACHVRRHREERPTHCKRGHELTKENSYMKPGTRRRECRTCRSLRRAGHHSGQKQTLSPANEANPRDVVSGTGVWCVTNDPARFSCSERVLVQRGGEA